MRALSQAGCELLGPDGRELVVLDTREKNPSWGLALRTIQPQTKATPCSRQPDLSPALLMMPEGTLSPWLLPLLRRFPYSLQEAQGHHVWKHACQALGSRVTDAVIVQAARNRSQGREWGAESRGIHTQLGLLSQFTDGQTEAASLWSHSESREAVGLRGYSFLAEPS